MQYDNKYCEMKDIRLPFEILLHHSYWGTHRLNLAILDIQDFCINLMKYLHLFCILLSGLSRDRQSHLVVLSVSGFSIEFAETCIYCNHDI